MLSPHASNLHALARLLPSAACHVLRQHRHHLVLAPPCRELQGSLALLSTHIYIYIYTYIYTYMYIYIIAMCSTCNECGRTAPPPSVSATLYIYTHRSVCVPRHVSVCVCERAQYIYIYAQHTDTDTDTA